MAIVTLKGNPIETVGTLPAVGTKAPAFTLTAKDLSEKTLADYAGKNIVLNIFPSVDTGTCAASVRAFNAQAAALENTVVLCVSKICLLHKPVFVGLKASKMSLCCPTLETAILAQPMD